MLLKLLLGASAVTAQCTNADQLAQNDPNPPYLNPNCNYAGTCITYDISTQWGDFTTYMCSCCMNDEENSCYGYWEAGQYGPQGGDCGTVFIYNGEEFEYHMEGPDATCPDENGYADPDLHTEVSQFYSLHGFDATIKRDTCFDCEKNTCEVSETTTDGIETVEYNTGVTARFYVDFHTWYDPGCEASDGEIRSQYLQSHCWANYDQGYSAYHAFYDARHCDDCGEDATADVVYVNEQAHSAYGWDSSTVVNQYHGKTLTSEQITAVLTKPPTKVPTPPPTDPPTPPPTRPPTTFQPTPPPTGSPISDPCSMFWNKMDDFSFKGVGDNCRGGLNSDWPNGGKADTSPYIIALPAENTPGRGKNPIPGVGHSPGFSTYFSDTHRYSIAECLDECRKDQRCLGVEFIPDGGEPTGDCNLVDDIPVMVDSESGTFDWDNYVDGQNVNIYGGSGQALCFFKDNERQDSYCNPYWTENEVTDDLLEEAMKCYCPDNRKGFYDKKVERTIENTRFCDSTRGGRDTTTAELNAINKRIRHAQMNRMFHLCENWCLFSTHYPEDESWYWDPWQDCWREEYAGTGTHRSYCNRVIRDPYTIEQQFINYRSTHFCDVNLNDYVKPNVAPNANSRWYLADEEQSCTLACEERNKECDESGTATFETDMTDILTEAAQEGAWNGLQCTSTSVGTKGWALPAFRPSYDDPLIGTCVSRNSGTTTSTGCQWATGVGYQRFCACF